MSLRSRLIPSYYFSLWQREKKKDIDWVFKECLTMHLEGNHFVEVEIISFESHCKLDGESYEQTVNVRTCDGDLIRLFDFMGFAVNESRLGKGKKIVLCVPYIEGDVTLLESGEPGPVGNDFDPQSVTPTKLTLIACILEADAEDQGLLVDVGFGELYVIADTGISELDEGDVIRFRASRLDLLEILE